MMAKKKRGKGRKPKKRANQRRKHKRRDPGSRVRTLEQQLSDLRSTVERARLDFQALFNAAEELFQGENLFDMLGPLAEADEDLIAALYVMELPMWQYDVETMIRDTRAALRSISKVRERLLDRLVREDRAALEESVEEHRALLYSDEAYEGVEGRAPEALSQLVDLPREILERLGRLPRASETWAGRLHTLGTYLREPVLHRPALVAWVDCGTGRIVGQKMLEEVDDHAAVLDVLVQTMLKPEEGAPRRPGTLQLTEASLAISLEEALEEVDVEVRPAPAEAVELLEDVEAVVELATARRPEVQAEFESYLAGGVPRETLADFFDAACRLHEVAPWDEILPERAVGLDLSRWGRERLCVGIPSRGLGVFIFDAMDDYVTLGEKMAGWRPDEHLVTTVDVLSITYQIGGDLPEGMRREVIKEGWRVHEGGAYPVVQKLDPDGIPVPLTQQDYWVATACACCLAELLSVHPKVLTRETASVTEQVRLPYWPNIEVQATVPYPLEELPSTTQPRCGLCGKTDNLIRTDCCGQWICDDEDQYQLFSFARNICSRNHRRYTLCGYHHAEGHPGDWRECSVCRDDFETEIYVYYGTNEYNFVKLEDPPHYEPTRCIRCNEIIRLGEDGYAITSEGHICLDCR